MKIEIWADLHSGLLTTPREDSSVSKGAVVRVLAQIFAQNSWMQAGTVTVRSLQSADDEFGPAHAAENRELAEWLGQNRPAQAVARPFDKKLTEYLEPGVVLYVVSDFQFEVGSWLPSLVDTALQSSAHPRFCRVCDEAEHRAEGLALSGRSLMIFDRTESSAQDLAEADRSHGQNIRQIVESSPDGRYAEVNIETSFLEVLRQLERDRLID
jgi:hypothetical protein